MSYLDPARIDELLERASGVRVLVVGDLMLDRYVSGRVDRVSPEAPVPVVLVEDEWTALGGAGNVAANVTALGAECSLVGCTGADTAGEQLRAALDVRGIDASGVVSAPQRPTTVKTRVHAKHQQVVRFDRETEDDVNGDVLAALSQSVRDLAATSDAVVLQDYNKGVLRGELVEVVKSVAERSDLPVIVDPKRRGFFCYAGATVFKPNKRELEDALGDFIHPDDEAWMEGTRARLGCANLLVTLGDQGMALQTAAGRLVRLPTAAQGVYDVSGAGDTVVAAVAVALAVGATVLEAAILANHAAAVEVGMPGVHTVTPDEVRAHLRARPD